MKNELKILTKESVSASFPFALTKKKKKKKNAGQFARRSYNSLNTA